MKKALIVVLVLILLIGGCMTVGRFLAPIQVGELDSAAQKMLSDTKSADKKVIDALTVKLTAKQKTSNTIPIIICTAALVFGAAIGYFAKDIMGGIVLAAGGGAGFSWIHFTENYPWADWVLLGIGVIIGGYFLWRYSKGTDAQTALKAIVPAIEAVEPKVLGSLPSGPIKAAILANATASKTLDTVTSAVADMKKTLGLKQGG